MGSFNRCEKHFNPKRCLKNENDTEPCSNIWLHIGHLHLILSFHFHSTKIKNYNIWQSNVAFRLVVNAHCICVQGFMSKQYLPSSAC